MMTQFDARNVRGSGRPWIVAVLVVVLILAGCASAQERQARQIEERAYRISLQRHVHGHVYQMRCAALLPLAEEMFWERGFRDISSDGSVLRTEWKTLDDMRRSRYEVHSHRVAHDRCAVQVMRQEEAGGAANQRRDSDTEFELLKRVNAEEASRVRHEARQEAKEAYKNAVRRQEEEQERQQRP